jgi:DnaJ like chaperone protein
VDPLTWLGLKRDESRPHLDAIHKRVRDLLPDDEPVVVRYIVIVAVLLTRVARADGRVQECERDRLRALFRHVERMPTEGIDALCDALNRHVPELDESEIELCFRELKTLCDGAERMQVMRLLAGLASVDGGILASEHGELAAIAGRLGISPAALAKLEDEAGSNGHAASG